MEGDCLSSFKDNFSFLPISSKLQISNKEFKCLGRLIWVIHQSINPRQAGVILIKQKKKKGCMRYECQNPNIHPQ